MLLHQASTDDLTPDQLTALRALLDDSFRDFDDHDWAHALGGTHVLAHDGPVLLGHASVVPRTLWYGDEPLHTGYVEAVAVHPAHRGHGHGARLMHQVAQLIEERYALGALSASASALGFYHRLGWRLWLGPTHVDTPHGRTPTPDDDGGIFVLPRTPLTLTAPLTCDWRPGDVW